MIELCGVSRKYGKRGAEVRALDGVDLSVDKGSFLCVRGPSGSGKSTLLLTIGGMVRPSNGQVMVGGKDIYAMSDGARTRYRARSLGFVFQMFHLVPYLSVLENAALPASLAGLKDGTERARSHLVSFGLEARLSHRPSELSTGERQRTAVARALVTEPELVLADEPTGNLDEDSSEAVLSYLKEYQSRGGTVAVVTHDRRVAEFATRIVEIRDGRISEVDE